MEQKAAHCEYYLTARTDSEKMMQKARTNILRYGTVIIFFAVVSIWGGTHVFAGSASANLPVTAEIIGNCTVNTNPLNFDYIAQGNEVTVSNVLSVNCSNLLSYTIELDNGQNGPDGVRRLTNIDQPEYELTYDLYHSDCTSRWHTGGEIWTGNGQDQPYTVCGKIFSGQDISAGTYNDIITVNIVIQ